MEINMPQTLCYLWFADFIFLVGTKIDILGGVITRAG
jgi:hypothetical protein